MGAFKDAHGGPLRNLYLDADAAEAAKRGSGGRKSWDLTERQLCDLELLDERRLLAARGLHGPGRLRVRARPTCASPAAPCGRSRSRST